MRWRLKLKEYEYEIEYTKGKDNIATDALSRIHAITDIKEIQRTNPKPRKVIPRMGKITGWNKGNETRAEQEILLSVNENKTRTF